MCPSAGVKKYIESRGLLMISDTAAVEAMVDRVLAANDKQLQVGGARVLAAARWG